ncbi:hypothetical protein O0I10_001014 [Lichtheimia ornata]|uniref:Uncharacterized protein n=1 Tax=Lichtheimia ornata TaxID=688661 RepID=A0AAD8DI68_9FUNG|nr:uncharacterized protein O0I10_001014 [Lichtheimia ornata]KAJ8662838.1 hypothetical protein O0I10_001014 [Lichtheimia ornata]
MDPSCIHTLQHAHNQGYGSSSTSTYFAPTEHNDAIDNPPMTSSSNSSNRFTKFRDAMKNIHYNNIKPTGFNIDHSQRQDALVDQFKSKVTGNVHSLRSFGVLARS